MGADELLGVIFNFWTGVSRINHYSGEVFHQVRATESCVCGRAVW